MADTAICFTSIKGLRMRATRLDSQGRWITGATSSAVSKGFVSIKLTDNIEAGTEYKQKNASGELCINEKDKDSLSWIDVEIEFCNVDPELVELVTGQRILTDQAGLTVGFTKANVTPPNIAFEAWTKMGGGGSGNHQWVYWLLAGLTNGWFGDITLEDGTATFTMKGNTFDNANWGYGPYNVVAVDASLTPGVLMEEVLDGEHLYTRTTEIAPPGDQCGYVALNTVWTTPPA